MVLPNVSLPAWIRELLCADTQTKTVEQAKAAVQNARVPDHGGKRSIGPNALLWGFNDAPYMMPVWNRASVIIQIESEEGAAVADEIAAVEGGEWNSRACYSPI